MKITVLCILIIIVAFSSAYGDKDVLGQYGFEFLTEGVDTIRHYGCTVYLLHGNCNGVDMISGLEIISGSDTLSMANCGIYFYDFEKAKLDTSFGAVWKDINRDGFDEIIIDVIWGGNHCCSDIRVIEFSNPPKEISYVWADDPTAELIDIDGDTIPEARYYYLGISDASFTPELIWKWDGEKYRLANYKLKAFFPNDSLICKTCLLAEMARVDSTYDAKNINNTYPVALFWDLLQIEAYYGKPEMIDSVFNKYWPDYNPGKQDAHDSFKASLEVNDLWNQLLNSDW